MSSSGRQRTLRPNLKDIRSQSGLTQAALAQMTGLARQSINKIEKGSTIPSTLIALQLARALGCHVEDLFTLSAAGTVRATLARPLVEARGTPSLRVVVGQLAGRWVAHQLNPLHRAQDLAIAADALLIRKPSSASPSGARSAKRAASVLIRPLGDPGLLADNLLLAGCDSALGILAEQMRSRRASRTIWLEASSGASLGALARAEVHIAGAHLFDEESGDYNVPFVRSAFAGRAVVLITVAQIEEGLALARGNPLRVRKLSHLARPGVRIINRERGAGARKLLDRLLASERITPEQISGYEQMAPGHIEAARAVALGAADAAMVTRSAALALDLDFLPLASERFDLALPQESLCDPRISRLLDTLASGSFRHELEAIGGYETRRSGSIAAELH